MRIFVAGASGVIGRELVPRLVERGHAVTGMTRTPGKEKLLRNLGAEPVVGDALVAESVAAAVAASGAEVVVHQSTSLATGVNPKRLDRSFEVTNRLRSEGTDNLLAAAKSVGARKFVAQSIAGWPCERTGAPVKNEEDPLDPSPPAAAARTHAAIRHLEEATAGAAGIEGIVLRYGFFYGPGTSLGLGPEGEQLDLIRSRRFPLVGSGEGVWSFVHVADAAAATVAAIEGGEPGIYNIVDDDPAAVSEWLPVVAAAIGAKPPMKVPQFVGRLAAGEFGVMMMTDMRGASNRKARDLLSWTPAYPSWRLGFKDGLR